MATGNFNFQTLKKVQNLRKTTPHYQKGGYGPDMSPTVRLKGAECDNRIHSKYVYLA